MMIVCVALDPADRESYTRSWISRVLINKSKVILKYVKCNDWYLLKWTVSNSERIIIVLIKSLDR